MAGTEVPRHPYHEQSKPGYAGPRYFIRHAELGMHPVGTGDRREALRGQHGLGLCNIIKCCTEVCPRGHQDHRQRAHPDEGALRDQRFDPLRLLCRSWNRRAGREPPAGGL